jgi:hypothetical protein
MRRPAAENRREHVNAGKMNGAVTATDLLGFNLRQNQQVNTATRHAGTRMNRREL